MPRVWSVLGGISQRGALTLGPCCCNHWALWVGRHWGKGTAHVWHCYWYQDYKIFSIPKRKLKITQRHRKLQADWKDYLFSFFFPQKSSLVTRSQNFLHQCWKKKPFLSLCWRTLSPRSWVNKISYQAILILPNLFFSGIPTAWPHSTGNRGGGGEERGTVGWTRTVWEAINTYVRRTWGSIKAVSPWQLNIR